MRSSSSSQLAGLVGFLLFALFGFFFMSTMEDSPSSSLESSVCTGLCGRREVEENFLRGTPVEGTGVEGVVACIVVPAEDEVDTEVSVEVADFIGGSGEDCSVVASVVDGVSGSRLFCSITSVVGVSGEQKINNMDKRFFPQKHYSHYQLKDKFQDDTQCLLAFSVDTFRRFSCSSSIVGGKRSRRPAPVIITRFNSVLCWCWRRFFERNRI